MPSGRLRHVPLHVFLGPRFFFYNLSPLGFPIRSRHSGFSKHFIFPRTHSLSSVGLVRSGILTWSVNIYASLAVAVQTNAGMAVTFTQTALVGRVLKGCFLTVFPPSAPPPICRVIRVPLVSTCFGRWPGPPTYQYLQTSLKRRCGRPRALLPLPSSP